MSSNPSSNKKDWEQLLGPTLIKDPKGKETVPTVKALKNKKMVLLYFSASWCPPCRSFSPILKEFYEHVKDQVEIIYISSDQSVPQFEEYFASMPWLSLPPQGTASIKQALAQAFQITGIPALIALTVSTSTSTSGEVLFVSDQAREQVTTCMKGGGKEAAQGLVKTWTEETQAVPLTEAKFQREGMAPTSLYGLFMTLLKNPAAIFALLYFIKWIMRKYQAMIGGQDEDGDGGAGNDAAEEASPVVSGEDEF